MVLAAVAAILWFFYSAQPHPVGTLAYDYLNEFPGYLASLVIVGVVLVLGPVIGSQKVEHFTLATRREPDKGSKSEH